MYDIILDEFGLKFETLYDLENYIQEHYENYTKEQLVKIISEIVLFASGD